MGATDLHSGNGYELWAAYDAAATCVYLSVRAVQRNHLALGAGTGAGTALPCGLRPPTDWWPRALCADLPPPVIPAGAPVHALGGRQRRPRARLCPAAGLWRAAAAAAHSCGRRRRPRAQAPPPGSGRTCRAAAPCNGRRYIRQRAAAAHQQHSGAGPSCTAQQQHSQGVGSGARRRGTAAGAQVCAVAHARPAARPAPGRRPAIRSGPAAGAVPDARQPAHIMAHHGEQGLLRACAAAAATAAQLHRIAAPNTPRACLPHRQVSASGQDGAYFGRLDRTRAAVAGDVVLAWRRCRKGATGQEVGVAARCRM